MNTRLIGQQDLDTAGVDREEFIKNCCGVVYSGACAHSVLRVHMLTHCSRPSGGGYSQWYLLLLG